MALIAILMGLGVGAFDIARSHNILDSRIEEAISNIREAQNRAISFSKWEGSPTMDVKIWGATYSGTDIYLTTVYNGGTANTHVRSSFSNGLTATNTGGSSTVVVYFVPPFGKAYIFNSLCNTWTASNLPTKEYVPSSSCIQLSSARITYTHRGLSRSFNINGQGEVKVE
jgi:hypothetical protein